VPGGDVASVPDPLTERTFLMRMITLKRTVGPALAATLAGFALVAVAPGAATAAGAPCQRTFSSALENKAIPEDGSTGSFIDVPEDGLVVADVDVAVNVLHSQDENLQIELRNVAEANSATRTQGLLFNRSGGSGDNVLGAVFDDEAADPVSWANPPFTGRFRPDRPLSVHDGLTGGRYLLIAADRGFGSGRLVDWSVTVSYVSCDFDSDGVEDHADQCLDLAARTATGCPQTSRTVTAKLKAGKFRGALSSPVAGCTAGRPVSVFRVRSGPDAHVGTVTTRSDGSWRLARSKKRGRYYATSPLVAVPGVAECPAVRSGTFRVR
jgi:hypothetical protein